MTPRESINDLVRLAEKLHRQLKTLSILPSTPAAESGSANLASYFALSFSRQNDEIFDTILQCAMHVVNAGGAGLTLFDPNKRRLIFTAAVGDGSEGILGYEVPLEGSQHGLAFATGEIQSATPLDASAEKSSGTTFRNVLVAPLIVDEDAIGTISAVNKKDGDHFTPNDMAAYAHFAELASTVVRQQQRENQLRQDLSGAENSANQTPEIVLSESEMKLLKAIRILGEIHTHKPERLSQVSAVLKTFISEQDA